MKKGKKESLISGERRFKWSLLQLSRWEQQRNEITYLVEILGLTGFRPSFLYHSFFSPPLRRPSVVFDFLPFLSTARFKVARAMRRIERVTSHVLMQLPTTRVKFRILSFPLLVLFILSPLRSTHWSRSSLWTKDYLIIHVHKKISWFFPLSILVTVWPRFASSVSFVCTVKLFFRSSPRGLLWILWDSPSICLKAFNQVLH